MLGDVQASDALFELTSSDDTELRVRAVLALVHLGDQRGIDAFRTIVTGDDKKLRKSMLTRARLVGWLSENTSCSKFTSPAAQKLFRELTLNAAEYAVRGRAASLLTGASDPETISCLIEACADESDFVRHLAITSLMKTTEPSRFKTLNSFLADSSPLCRRTAIELIASLLSETDSSTDTGLSISDSVSAVAPLLSDDDAVVRQAAIRCLFQFYTQAPKQVGRHVVSIRRLTFSDPDRTIRFLANRLLTQIEE